MARQTDRLALKIFPVNPTVASGTSAVFGGFACFYALLRSNNIFATDGAHRCLEVFHRQRIFFHENNHLLYPVNVFVWTRLAAALGMKPNGPFEFYKIVELMNCFAAAASLAIVFLVIYITVSSWQLSLGVVVALGLSKAFFQQATNANEAVVGLFWSLTAILVLAAGLRVRRTWLIFTSGLIFSLSMATYESMIFLAPASVVLIWQIRTRENRESFLLRPLVVAEGTFLLGCLVAWLGLHGWADWMTGDTRLVDMVKQLFLMKDARSYIGLSPTRVLNLPVGMVRNIYPVLIDFDGLRHVLTGPKTSLVIFLLVSTFLGAFIILCILHLWKGRIGMSEHMRIGLLTGLAGLLFTLVPLLIWDPGYDKLWLQPLVSFAFLIAISLKIPALRDWKSVLIFRVAPVVLLVGIFFNFLPIISGHRTDVSAYFRDAQDVSEKVGREDLVVSDWGPVSILYGDVWAPQNRIFDFITEAVYYGKRSTERLSEEVLQTQRRGGRVYFLGLLDQSEPQWNSFIGARCGVPMSDIEPYRKYSHTVAIYQNGPSSISLRQWDPSLRK